MNTLQLLEGSDLIPLLLLFLIFHHLLVSFEVLTRPQVRPIDSPSITNTATSSSNNVLKPDLVAHGVISGVLLVSWTGHEVFLQKLRLSDARLRLHVGDNFGHMNQPLIRLFCKFAILAKLNPIHVLLHLICAKAADLGT